MPITQARMLSLLAAAEDYAQAMNRFARIANITKARVESGQISPESAFDLIAVESLQSLLEHPMESNTVIKMERFHFNKEAKRNARKAEKMAENRAAKRLNSPKPNRGDGGYFGRMGAGRGSFKPPVNVVPDPDLLGAAVKPAEEKLIQMLSKSTDAQQVSADSELFPSEPDEAGKAAALGFLENLERQEEYRREYGDDSKPAKPKLEEDK